MNELYYLNLLDEKIKNTWAELVITEKKMKTQRAAYHAAMAEKQRFLFSKKEEDHETVKSIDDWRDRNKSDGL